MSSFRGHGGRGLIPTWQGLHRFPATWFPLSGFLPCQSDRNRYRRRFHSTWWLTLPDRGLHHWGQREFPSRTWFQCRWVRQGWRWSPWSWGKFLLTAHSKHLQGDQLRCCAQTSYGQCYRRKIFSRVQEYQTVPRRKWFLHGSCPIPVLEPKPWYGD